MSARDAVKNAVGRLTALQRQIGTACLLLAGAVLALWAVFAATEKPKAPLKQTSGPGAGSHVTNVQVMPGGAQVNPIDQWVGNAGKKLSAYEKEREEQDKLNGDQKAFQAQTMKRFSALEEQLRSQANAQAQPTQPPIPAGTSPVTGGPPIAQYPSTLPPPPPPPRNPQAGTLPAGVPGYQGEATQTGIVRISLADGAKPSHTANEEAASSGEAKDTRAKTKNVETFLPVSFTRGVLLGGLDAPTGGQSQANPQPVLIRLSDNAVLPNRFRSDVVECFVIAAGYGDISAERAYLRTENLSCVRKDGSTLEVKIEGTINGEDGKVGMRGRLVTKQGQILANALLAGIVGGIGQGLGQRDFTYSSSAFGTVGTISGNDALKNGVGQGVGKALDRLAQYYIKLAEQTFPVIEVDAGREVDVIITKGVAIPADLSLQHPASAQPDPADARYLRTANDEDY